MPAGNRIRGNNAYGTTTDNPLTAGATTFNSAALPRLPVVSSAHAVVVLDPKRVFGEPEIVVVTSHAALATVATIVRGQYGTVARSHPVGTVWAHVPVDEDFIEIVAATSEITNPYEGQFLYNRTNKRLMGYGGVDWASRDAGGYVTSNGVTVDQGFFTAETSITGMTVTFTALTGRRYRVTAVGGHYSDAATDNRVLVNLKEGATILKQYQSQFVNNIVHTQYIIIYHVAPTAGSHTYFITLQRNGGAGQIAHRGLPTDPAFILVEDIGSLTL